MCADAYICHTLVMTFWDSLLRKLSRSSFLNPATAVVYLVKGGLGGFFLVYGRIWLDVLFLKFHTSDACTAWTEQLHI